MNLRTKAVLLAVLAISVAVPSSAAAASGDTASTQAYLQANYALVSYAASHIRTAEATLDGVLAGVRRECPDAAAESPEDVDSEQLSNEAIGAMVTTVVQHNVPVARRFVAAVAPLRWGDAGLTRAVRTYVRNVRTLLALPVPSLCSDVKAWAASDFRTLPATSASFDARFVPAWVGVGELPAGLAAYEPPADRSLVRRTVQLEQEWTNFEAREVETWGSIMDAMVLQP